MALSKEEILEAISEMSVMDIVDLIEAMEEKFGVSAAVRSITGLGLKDAKGLVDGAPSVIKEGIKKTEADEYAKQLEEAGAKAEFK